MDRQGTTTAPRHIKVAIMDESELVVHGIRAMFEPHSAVVSVVPYRTTGPAPLCDLTLYEPSAHRRTTSAPQRFPTRMVAFGWDCTPEAVSTEMSRGAAGFVSKWLPTRRLIWNLLQIADGRVVVDAWSGKGEPAKPTAAEKWPLTHRETEVLSMIASGLANREIAEQTNLSINSVKSYIRGAYAKIEVTSRSQAVLWAIQHGLLMSGDPVMSVPRAAAQPVRV
jgi:NarL family two-component system response regulator LiaR